MIKNMSATDDNNDQHGGGGDIMISSKKECTSCEQTEVVNNITEGIDSIAIRDDVSTCANCGKEGDDIKNVCKKCKQVRYCNAVCKKIHKKKHKKDCEEHIRLATEKHNEELRIAAELRDEKLFKLPPSQYGDCPICFLRMPTLDTGRNYHSCCGKVICGGCNHAPVYDNQGNEVDNQKCAFCRSRFPKSEEELNERRKKRFEEEDSIAMFNIGCSYYQGTIEYPQDYTKAFELWQRSGELGYAKAYANIGYAYNNGDGVKRDKKKAVHYWELAAMAGDVFSRYNLGIEEDDAANIDRALKHYMIAVRSGHSKSLEVVKDMYSSGDVSKEDYMEALRSYQAYLGEIKSEQRDKAAAEDEDNRYY